MQANSSDGLRCRAPAASAVAVCRARVPWDVCSSQGRWDRGRWVRPLPPLRLRPMKRAAKTF